MLKQALQNLLPALAPQHNVVAKSAVEPPHPGSAYNSMTFMEYLLSSEWGQVAAFQAVRYYDRIAPLATAVDMLSDEYATLEPLLFNDLTKEFEKDDPVYDLLRKPNAITDRDLFMRQMSAFYLLTGNAFVMATGQPNKPPLELFIIPSQQITIRPNFNDGMPEQYLINGNSTIGPQITFTRKETPQNMRFFDDSGSRELYHIKDFNPNTNVNNLFGQSRLSAIYMEMEQHYQSSRHNLSLLQKGARLSGALVAKGTLSEEQYARLQDQVDKFWAGTQNAGRIMLAEGEMQFQEMSINNRDMDFRSLKQDVASAIYTRLKIPLALISPDHMTMSNMDSARLNLYDMAVLPMTDRLYSELTKMLRPRYQWDKNLIFRYDQEAIPALQVRRNSELKTKQQIGVLTINEIRQLMAFPKYKEGKTPGDVLYQPNKLVPVDNEPPESTTAVPLPVEGGTSTANPPKKPSPKPNKKEFVDVMRKQYDKFGNRLYTELQINQFAEAEGLE